MKYIMLGLVALVLTSIMFVLMSKAVYVELRDRTGKGKSDSRN
jgi:uncharacterized membrane protein